MSADNGYIIRKTFRNGQPKFVLQEYSASAESYPSINNPRANPFDTLLDAVMAYSALRNQPGFICEYGLDIDIERITT